MTLEALYEDVYSRLAGNSALMALLKGDGIYDFIPGEQVKGPYIVIGDTHEVEGRTIDAGERKVFVRLHIWSSYRGRREIVRIERAIEAALTDGAYLFESFQIVRDEDDWMHGIVVLRTYIDKED